MVTGLSKAHQPVSELTKKNQNIELLHNKSCFHNTFALYKYLLPISLDM